MKHLSVLLSLFLLVFLLPKQSQACIDPDTSVIVICTYDSNYVDMELRITNLRLMNENPNKFCTCAVSSYSSLFTDLKYVAFVDSGTHNVYGNFAQWDLSMNSTNAWNTAQPGNGGWSGFVAEVIGAGLNFTHPVELIVRAGLPAGYTFSILDSSVVSSALATDEWDDANQALGNSHQRVRRFWDNPTQYVKEGASYFATADSIINAYYSTHVAPLKGFENVQLAPNPFNSELHISFRALDQKPMSITLYDLTGRKLAVLDEFRATPGFTERSYQLAPYHLAPGTYLVRLRSDEGVLTRKLVKSE